LDRSPADEAVRNRFLLARAERNVTVIERFLARAISRRDRLILVEKPPGSDAAHRAVDASAWKAHGKTLGASARLL
jgi:hypothetical protein